MKNFRLMGMALLAIIMCISFVSCSDDDDPIPNTLVGTEWIGTDQWNYVSYLRFGTDTYRLTVDHPDGTEYYSTSGSYVYDSAAGWITADFYGEEVWGEIKGNAIRVDMKDLNITFYKK